MEPKDMKAWFTCAMVKSRYIGDGHPTFNRNPYNGYINPYYWVDDHPLTQGTNGSLDPGTNDFPFQRVIFRENMLSLGGGFLMVCGFPTNLIFPG